MLPPNPSHALFPPSALQDDNNYFIFADIVPFEGCFQFFSAGGNESVRSGDELSADGDGASVWASESAALSDHSDHDDGAAMGGARERNSDPWATRNAQTQRMMMHRTDGGEEGTDGSEADDADGAAALVGDREPCAASIQRGTAVALHFSDCEDGSDGVASERVVQ